MVSQEFKIQVLETFAALITAAFGLVAALAWNETIKTAVAQVFNSDDSLIGLLVYAIIVTVLAVIMTIYIARALGKAKAAVEKKN
jgi:hypothetical protein